jgi:hypothetical protein
MAEKKTEGKNGAGSVPAGHEDALAALEGLGNQEGTAPAEHDVAADSEVEGEMPAGEVRPGSATGFAAMLAQDGGGAATTGSGTTGTGSPSINGGSSQSETKSSSRARQDFEELPVAKLVGERDDSTGKVTIAPAESRPRRSKESYKVLIPIMAVLGFLLLMIGLWSLAAICGMSVPGMPGRHQMGYHSSLLNMKFLVLALPVSLALLVLAFMMLRQLDKSNDAG